MTREEYIEYRTGSDITFVAMDYFSERVKDFRFYTFFAQIFNTFRGLRKAASINWNLLWSHYDNKFELQILFDKEGRFIKVVN